MVRSQRSLYSYFIAHFSLRSCIRFVHSVRSFTHSFIHFVLLAREHSERSSSNKLGNRWTEWIPSLIDAPGKGDRWTNEGFVRAFITFIALISFAYKLIHLLSSHNIIPCGSLFSFSPGFRSLYFNGLRAFFHALQAHTGRHARLLRERLPLQFKVVRSVFDSIALLEPSHSDQLQYELRSNPNPTGKYDGKFAARAMFPTRPTLKAQKPWTLPAVYRGTSRESLWPYLASSRICFLWQNPHATQLRSIVQGLGFRK